MDEFVARRQSEPLEGASAAPPFEAVLRVRRLRMALWVTLGAATVLGTLLAARATHTEASAIFGAGVLACLAVAAARTRKAGVVADAAGLRIEGDGAVRAASILSATEQAAHDGGRVRLVLLDGPTLELSGFGQHAPSMLLAALGRDPSRVASSFWVRDPIRWRRALLLAAVSILLWLTDLTTATTWGLFALFVVFAAAIGVPARLVVGEDGIVLRRLLRRPRFVPFADVREVVHELAAENDRAGSEVRLTLKSGRDMTLQLYRQESGDATAELCLLIERAWQAFDARRVEYVAGALVRGRLSFDDWLHRLRSAASGELATYRDAPIPRDALWSAAEDAAASVETRAAATVALGTNADDGDRARFRVVAQRTAEPALRRVLETAASGEDVGLHEAVRAACDKS